MDGKKILIIERDNMKYLLSVVIPTKDRYEYLKECLRTLVDLKSNLLEIVVQDNTCENKEILEYIADLNSTNIKYFHHSEPLSQMENSEYAVEHATGKYCCYIGDDDAITQAALQITEFMDKNEIDACVSNVATYHWNDVVFEGRTKPTLSFDSSGGMIKTLKSKDVLQNVLSYGIQDIKYLPRVYHGILSKKVLEAIHKTANVYFPGPSPDMANAIAASLIIDQYICVDLPLIVSGYSFKSAGGMGLRGVHKGDLKDAKQLPIDAEENWSERIPKIWLGYTVWPESAEKAFIKMKTPGLIKQINYVAMEAKIFLRYPEYRRMVYEETTGMKHRCKFFYECTRFMIKWLHERLRLYYRIASGRQYRTYEPMSLTEACDRVEAYNSANISKIKRSVE